MMSSTSASSSNVLRVFRRHLLRECITLLLFASLLLQSATAVAPDWWTTRGAVMPDADSDDYAVANNGQLKTIAKKAAQEMADHLPGGAGTTISAMIDAWTAPPLAGVTRDDYATLTLGQLKTAAKPFYDRLAAVGARAAGSYPWTGTSADDYALANLGQVKTAFAFAVPPLIQLASQSGIPSAQLLAAVQAWQAVPMDQRAEDATLDDLDGDGISNLQEYLMGTPIFDPADIDGDRIPNTVEDLYPGIMSKSRFADAVADHDGDGVMNFEEILLGLDLAAADSGRSDGLNDAQVLATYLKQTLPGTVRETSLRSFWDYSIDSLADDNDDGLLTDHPEWMNTDDGDANGLPDGWEQYLADYVPPVTRTAYTDCDGDHMSDIWEYRYQLDPRDPWDAGMDITTLVDVPVVPSLPQQADYPVPAEYAAALAQYQHDLYTYPQLHAFMLQEDPDEDQLCNLREYYLGSNPRLADTDGDATTDTAAVAANLDPSGGGANQGEGAKADDDGDGLTNAQELQLGLDPSVSNANLDQDHDSFTDVEEALAGSDVFDSGSRCGPAILVRSKDFGYGASKTVTADTGTHIQYTSQYFQGYANNDYGDSFFDTTPQTGTGNLDLANLASSVRSAFESGSFGGSALPAYPSISFGNDRPTPTYCTTFTTGYDTGNEQNEEHHSWGHAKEFTILGATIPDPPAASWTRMYLVTKFTGDPHQIGFESDLTDGTEAGIIVFSQDEDGNQSIDYEGSETDAIQVVADADGNESLVIMPLQVDEQVISYRLSPVTITFEAPAIAPRPLPPNPVSPEPEPLADGGSAPNIPAQQYFDNNTEITDAQFAHVSELRIAKLTDALKPLDSTYRSFKLDSSSEIDSFVVKIKGLPNNPARCLTLNLSTYGLPAQEQFADINDDATQIPMHFDSASGNYTTARQLLVAHRADDEYKSSTPDNNEQIFGPDNVDVQDPALTAPSDRTHLAGLGSRIKIDSIIISGVANSDEIPLRNLTMSVKSRKTVTVAVYAFADSGVVQNEQVTGKVWSDLQTARNTLAQVGVALEVEEGFPKVIQLPTGAESSEIEAYQFAKDRTPNSPAAPKVVGIPSAKGKQLIDACTEENSRFTLIYCRRILAGPGVDDYDGYAYPMKNCNGNNAAYNNHAFVASFNNNSQLAFVHELVHLLTNAAHFGQSYPSVLPPPGRIWTNLMRTGKPASNYPGIDQACRLEQLQQVMIDKVLP